jgi:exosortase F-associated protein
MLQKLIENRTKIIQILFLVGLFVLIRAFEDQLFYDPFLSYFKTENASVYPKIDFLKLFLNLFYRYFLNTIISLGILYIIFKDLNLIKFSSVLYILFFIILTVLFYIFQNYLDESHKMILFYIRRFIIQPIFVLLFVPGFYFQKQSDKK